MAVESTTQPRGEPCSRQASSSQASGSVSRKGSTAGRSRVLDERMIGQWRIGRTIGKGSSGRVKIAKHAITGKYAAIKIVPKGLIISSRMSVSEAGARADKVLLGIEREIVIMKLIDHPNVLNLYDVWETSSELYLIMEYVPGGELFDYLVKRGRLPVSEALHYFQQIIHAVDYCHRFNICHRDLKPENLLLDKDKNIKVADFGMAAWEAGERMLETSCGSPHYASPEIVAGKAYHGSSSDIWSCGIILFALLTGRLPFDDDNIRSLLQKVKVGVFEMPDEIKGPARDLLFKMLEKDPEKRILMPDILSHPFFVSRSPRPIPGRSLVSPPSLDEVDSPVSSADEIDEDIMSNLKTLWSGAADDEIVAALMSKDKTWEKAIYHLLVKYRNKHLENYNMEEEDDEATQTRRAARKAVTSSSPPKRKGTAPKRAPLGENETLQDSVTTTPVQRPQAPTPKKASAQPEYESPVPNRPQSKVASRPVMGPRPPMTRGNTAASDVTSPVHGTPSIVLQEATPTKDMLPPKIIPSRPQSVVSTAPPPATEAQLAALNVPQVKDEQLQHFFNEVAAQLNTMNIRSSVASGSSSSSAIMGSDYQAYLSYLGAGGIGVPPQESAGTETMVDSNQFADADDDETEAASIHSMAMSIVPQHSPLVGLGLGGPPLGHGARPALHPSPAVNTNRWSYASSNGSSYRGPSASSYPPQSPSPSINPQGIMWADPNPAPTPHTQVMFAQRAPPPPPAARVATRAAPAPPRPISTVSTGGELTRDGSFIIINHADTPSVDQASFASRQSQASSGFSAHRQDAFGMLKKKKKVTIDPVAYSPSQSGPQTGGSSAGPSSGSRSDSSPKRSWFNNLFSFKPAPATLLSHANIGDTRDAVKRTLAELGVRVAVVEIDGLRGLKCKFDDIKDSAGNINIKGVRFRVEFARSNAATTGGNYNTLVSLALEKGAQSSFRNIFNSLKASIEEDAAAPTPIIRRPPPPIQIHSYVHPQNEPHPARAPMSATISGPASRQMLSAPPVRWTHSAPTSPNMPSTPRFDASPQPPRSSQLAPAIRF
ncbi:serine/threonine-protein kinase [Dioszegia hungarica]|uniref:non-specific serine/threonine protein kinase n=1 Tax=Dioszegia hungarica TaxID=4972 RepID=A0AA38HAS4_9TREE|nr:serine/threonine-protein kinase [Dioszegia hungarica]KAI9635899.1 serine/threonine-protein kinase [Dioszegia hungarica]